MKYSDNIFPKTYLNISSILRFWGINFMFLVNYEKITSWNDQLMLHLMQLKENISTSRAVRDYVNFFKLWTLLLLSAHL